MKSLCVFLGSNISIKPEYFKHARELAAGLVKNNIRLVYGGGNNGLMGAIANTVIELGGQVIGVITEELYDKEGHCELTELVVVKSMHQRKQLLAQHANGFIAMPGGFGTLEEIFEIINGAKLKLHSKPIYLFNINGYFNHLLAFLDQATQEKFLHIQYNDLFKVFDNYAQILDDFMRWDMHGIDINKHLSISSAPEVINLCDQIRYTSLRDIAQQCRGNLNPRIMLCS